MENTIETNFITGNRGSKYQELFFVNNLICSAFAIPVDSFTKFNHRYPQLFLKKTSVDPHFKTPFSVQDVCWRKCWSTLFFPWLMLSYFYRPQTKFAKVMFLQVSVCPQGGGRACHMTNQYISRCIAAGSQLVWRQHTGNIKCMMG